MLLRPKLLHPHVAHVPCAEGFPHALGCGRVYALACMAWLGTQLPASCAIYFHELDLLRACASFLCVCDVLFHTCALLKVQENLPTYLTNILHAGKTLADVSPHSWTISCPLVWVGTFTCVACAPFHSPRLGSLLWSRSWASHS